MATEEARRPQVRLMNVVIDCADVGRAPRICFQRVPEGKVVKNRVHMDFEAEDEEATVAQIQSLGATFLWRSSNPEDPFVTMGDPEGNEFCVVRSVRPPG